MQAELSSSQPLLDIEVMGVNWTGLESANPEATENKSIPWLQDVDSDVDGGSDTWAAWGAEHLDLVILDAHNEPLSSINLISTSLNEQENYAFLHDLLVDAAMDSQKPWHNAESPPDIDGNGVVIPLDVLLIVNRLDSVGAGRLPAPGVQVPQVLYDSNGDGDSTPLDVLLVINFLNGQTDSGSGEGESFSATVLSSDHSHVVLQPLPSLIAPTPDGTTRSTPDSGTQSDYKDWQRPVNRPKYDSARATNADRAFQEETIDWLSEHSSRDQIEIYRSEDHALWGVSVDPD
jgi:hypothetical protein